MARDIVDQRRNLGPLLLGVIVVAYFLGLAPVGRAEGRRVLPAAALPGRDRRRQRHRRPQGHRQIREKYPNSTVKVKGYVGAAGADAGPLAPAAAPARHQDRTLDPARLVTRRAAASLGRAQAHRPVDLAVVLAQRHLLDSGVQQLRPHLAEPRLGVRLRREDLLRRAPTPAARASSGSPSAASYCQIQDTASPSSIAALSGSRLPAIWRQTDPREAPVARHRVVRRLAQSLVHVRLLQRRPAGGRAARPDGCPGRRPAADRLRARRPARRQPGSASTWARSSCCSIGHAHPDHCGPQALMWRGWSSAAGAAARGDRAAGGRRGVPPVGRSRGPDRVHDRRARRRDRYARATASALTPPHHGGPEIGPAVLYDVTGPDGARLLYAVDTAPLAARGAARAIRSSPYDVAAARGDLRRRGASNASASTTGSTTSPPPSRRCAAAGALTDRIARGGRPSGPWQPAG